MTPKAIEWLGGKLRILDQSKLPHEQRFIDLVSYQDVALAIKEMRVRGAPAIGIAAAYGIALGAQDIRGGARKEEFLAQLNQVIQTFAATRPTAVNLFQAIERMSKIVRRHRINPWHFRH
jgi:methylthioribose-1-phosphate isomerase